MIDATLQQERTDQYLLTYNAYAGDGGFSDGSYLYEFHREVDFSDRKCQASYTNLLRPIIRAQVDPVFSHEAQRSGGDELLDAFLANVDNNGRNIQSLVHQAVTETKLLGNFFVVMDNFKAEDLPDTKDDVLNTRKFPYVYTKSLYDMQGYKTDMFGRLLEITFFYGEFSPKNDQDAYYVYKRYTLNGIEKYKVALTGDDAGKKQIIDSVVHSLNKVPVIYWNRQEVAPLPPYYDIAKQSQNIYNIQSQIFDHERAQNFSILVIPSISPSSEQADNMVIGEKNALFVNSEVTNLPTYISPDSTITTNSLEYFNQSVDTLIQSADILGSSASQRSGKGESGNTMAFKFYGKMQEIKNTARMAEDLEQQIVQMFGAFVDVDYLGYEVSYSDKFTPTFEETMQRIKTNSEALALNLSDELNLKMKKDIVALLAINGNWDKNELEEVRESLTSEPIADDTMTTIN